jgi:hypothetical protein
MWSVRFREPLDRTFEQWQRSFRRVLLTTLLVVTASSCYAQVGVTPDGKPVRCNFAKIRSGSTIVRVFVQPKGKSHLKTSLRDADIVYTCDSYGKWTQVFFSSRYKPCHSGTRDGLPETNRNDCEVGWVRTKWVNIISG